MPALTFDVLVERTLERLRASPAELHLEATTNLAVVKKGIADILRTGLDVMEFGVDANGEIVDRTGQMRARDDKNFRHAGSRGLKRIR